MRILSIHPCGTSRVLLHDVKSYDMGLSRFTSHPRGRCAEDFYHCLSSGLIPSGYVTQNCITGSLKVSDDGALVCVEMLFWDVHCLISYNSRQNYLYGPVTSPGCEASSTRWSSDRFYVLLFALQQKKISASGYERM
jgi:hypothetical protein